MENPAMIAFHRARDLKRTCYLMSRSNEHGLAPGIAVAQKNGSLVPKKRADHPFLRPEFTESIYVMYQITGDPTYREWGEANLG